MADDLSAAQPGAPLGSARSWRLRLIRAANLTIATDPALADLYRTRFEGAPPKVRVRGGVVAVEYGPRFRPANWGRQAAELTLNPSVGWRIEAPKGLEGLRADLRAIQLLGLEVQHATSKAEVTLARPVGTVLLRFGGASEVTIHRPTGTAARVQVTGGASRVSFDDQFYKAVGGEASWTTSDFEQATDRYDIDFSRGVRDLVVDTLEVQVARRSQRLLATVLFTDIVGSTERARAVGDQRWRELLDLHDEAARRLVDQEGGRLIKSTGDGILAVFDRPGRGIRCALALREELRDRGSRSGPGSTPERSTSAATTWAGSRSTWPPGSWPPPAPVRSWCPGPSGTWSGLRHRPGGPWDPHAQGPGRPLAALCRQLSGDPRQDRSPPPGTLNPARESWPTKPSGHESSPRPGCLDMAQATSWPTAGSRERMTSPHTVGGDLGNGDPHSASPPFADREAVTSRSVPVEHAYAWRWRWATDGR